MNMEEIAEFTYARNRLWREKLTKEQVKRTFEVFKNNVIEERRDGELIGVGVYIRFRDELFFISATVREDTAGVVIMLRALKEEARKKGVEYISWFNRKNQLKRWRV